MHSSKAGIGTKYNKEFFKIMLAKFGIESLNSDTGILIGKKKSLQIALELPLFRYADGRLFRLRELLTMISTMKHAKASQEERERIVEYFKQGLNSNQIVPLLRAEYEKARRSSTIRKAITDFWLWRSQHYLSRTFKTEKI